MKIQRVNNTTNIAMNGNIITKDIYSRTISEAVKNSVFFRKLSQNNDVVVRVSYIIPEDINLDLLFKITYSVLKENSNIDRILDALHLKPRNEYNKQYKLVEDLVDMLKGYTFYFK